MKESKKGGMAPWVVAGLVVLALLIGLVWRYGLSSSPARALAFKATRVDLVGQMQVALGAAAEAEKSAVLAATDQASQLEATRSRAARAEVERARVELERLLREGGPPEEQAQLAQLTLDLEALRAVDEEVLRLAVKNTNLKASALAFGPAAAALAELDQELGRVTTRRAGSPKAAPLQRLADRARIGCLKIQALLAPHIAEEGEEGMNRLEAVMTGEVREVRRSLAALSDLVGATELAPASRAFNHYLELQAQVLALSRENTNVRSLTLSLGKKRAALAVCQDHLAALQQAILAESIPGLSYGGLHPTR